MRILVTDGDNRAALAIVRALGASGHWVAVGERSERSLAGASRYCNVGVSYPDPARHQVEFIERLLALVDEHRVDVVLPVTDITTLLLTEHRGRFPLSCRIPFPPADAVARAADKVGVLESAKRLGIPVPRTVVATDRNVSVQDLALPYPVVVKPARSRVLTRSGWVSCSVGYAADQQQLRTQLAERPEVEFPLALQEKISGPGVGIFLCLHDGRSVARFAHRRIREKPPSGGVSVLSESIEMSPLAMTYAERLLVDVGWEGVAMVEFKLDERDGVPKLMEINGRFWGSLQLAIDAGVDFPNILVATSNGHAPSQPPAYTVGVRNRWFWGDVDALLIQLLGKPGSQQQRPLQALADFCQVWGRKLYYENPKWNDLRPWLYETRTWLTGER